MTIQADRRTFLGSMTALLASGCRMPMAFSRPNLTVGILSDPHVTTPQSCALFERSLRYFRTRGVDAVMVPGDLTDWGIKASLRSVKETWDRVFAGTDVVPLFCTGNHDFDGWWYPDMTMELHANGYHENDLIVPNRESRHSAMARVWEEIFGEKYEDVMMKTVRGYDFVWTQYYGFEAFPDWMARHAARFSGPKPFFFFQHLSIRGTTPDSFGFADRGIIKPVLERYPNCIAFTGHTHRPFSDERQIWQGAFTAVSLPSLSYACYPKGHENGGGPRDGTSGQAMCVLPDRRDLRGGHGVVMSVWDDEVVLERIDLEEMSTDLPPWIVPLSVSDRPFAEGVRDADAPVPVFPAAAKVLVSTRNTENRSGKWITAMNCEFPTPRMPAGSRVYDYEIRVVAEGGEIRLRKKFLSPAFSRMARFEPRWQRFWFDAAELPQGERYRIEVRAFNCFGRASCALVSETWRSVPGKDSAFGMPPDERIRHELGPDA